MKTKTYKEKLRLKQVTYVSLLSIIIIASFGLFLYCVNQKDLIFIISLGAIVGLFTWLLVDGIRIYRNPKVLIDVTFNGIEYLYKKDYKKISWEELDKIWIIQKSYRGNVAHKLLIKINEGNDEEIILEIINLGRTTEFEEIYRNIRDNLREIDKQKEDIEADYFIDSWLTGQEEGKRKGKDTGFRRAAIKAEMDTEEKII
ncbi:MAG: hypothetical protein ACRC57_10045 [Sarcina sp.]